MKPQQTPAAVCAVGQAFRPPCGQQRLSHFGITMIVMGASFFLYYLGFFGRVDGPLNPAQLGEQLAVSGVSKTHFIFLAAVLVLVSLCWNWIFNLACLRLGRRLTCSRVDEEANTCGAMVRRQTASQKKNSRRAQGYVCAHGHIQPQAHFHPLKKGTFGHMLWVTALMFAFVVFYAAYC